MAHQCQNPPDGDLLRNLRLQSLPANDKARTSIVHLSFTIGATSMLLGVQNKLTECCSGVESFIRWLDDNKHVPPAELCRAIWRE